MGTGVQQRAHAALRGLGQLLLGKGAWRQVWGHIRPIGARSARLNRRDASKGRQRAHPRWTAGRWAGHSRKCCLMTTLGEEEAMVRGQSTGRGGGRGQRQRLRSTSMAPARAGVRGAAAGHTPEGNWEALAPGLALAEAAGDAVRARPKRRPGGCGRAILVHCLALQPRPVPRSPAWASA